jgi:NAD dependent epimerase/dehydratase
MPECLVPSLTRDGKLSPLQEVKLGNVKVLVTGSGGFIGSHLTHRLVIDGFQVRALIHYNSRNDWGQLQLIPDAVLNEIEVIAGDMQDPFAVQKAVKGCEVVYHLASLIAIPYSYVAPHAYVSVNIMGALNVMEGSLREGVRRVVHTSTSECYGTARFVPIDENHPLQGQSPYSASKIGADMIAESYYRSFGLPVVTIRPFNTYGPRQSARAIIPTVISQALRGGTVRLGALTPTRDFNFVDDTVAGFILAGATPDIEGEVINIGSGHEISIGDLAELILQLSGSEATIEIDSVRMRPEKSEVERLLCNNAKARQLLGWAPATTLEEGLRQTIEWFRSNLNRYKADIYNL